MIQLLRTIFVEDFWLKLFSLVLAILIWLTIYFARLVPGAPLPLLLTQRTLTKIPIAVVSSAGDTRNFQVSPSRVDVVLEGTSALLSSINPGDVHVIVDLTGIQATERTRKRIEVSTPAGITHLRVSPEEVEVIPPVK